MTILTTRVLYYLVLTLGGFKIVNNPPVLGLILSFLGLSVIYGNQALTHLPPENTITFTF